MIPLRIRTGSFLFVLTTLLSFTLNPCPFCFKWIDEVAQTGVLSCDICQQLEERAQELKKDNPEIKGVVNRLIGNYGEAVRNFYNELFAVFLENEALQKEVVACRERRLEYILGKKRKKLSDFQEASNEAFHGEYKEALVRAEQEAKERWVKGKKIVGGALVIGCAVGAAWYVWKYYGTNQSK